MLKTKYSKNFREIISPPRPQLLQASAPGSWDLLLLKPVMLLGRAKVQQETIALIELYSVTRWQNSQNFLAATLPGNPNCPAAWTKSISEKLFMF